MAYPQGACTLIPNIIVFLNSYICVELEVITAKLLHQLLPFLAKCVWTCLANFKLKSITMGLQNSNWCYYTFQTSLSYLWHLCYVLIDALQYWSNILKTEKQHKNQGVITTYHTPPPPCAHQSALHCQIGMQANTPKQIDVWLVCRPVHQSPSHKTHTGSMG
jgi:hypothetical protein